MKTITLEILRRARGESTSHWQTFSYDLVTGNETVASVLTALNAREPLMDTEGKEARPIVWECSCLQKKCGACAVVVQGKPCLACDAKLALIKGDVVRVEPLRKFPVICDLMVDRSILFENLKTLKLWLSNDASLPDNLRPLAYEASECLQCGCCLEVCPNFNVENGFAGMAGMVPLARLLVESGSAERGRLAESYRDSIHGGCGKSLACRDICPAGIDIAHLMSRSNAAAVWGRS